MTTPTTAEQIDAVLQAVAIVPDGIVGTMREVRAIAAALTDARATIARLEEERRNLALKLQQVDEELAVDGHYNTVEKAILVRAQANRADAAKETITRLEGELNALRPVVQKNMPVAAQHISEIVAENHALRTRADAAERRGEVMAKGLKAVEALINESHGVIGLHLNGDDAPWEDLRTGGGFEEWLREFDAALAAASGAKEGR